MDWFPHYIDDYDADTLHLTPAEDGVYHRLLRWYYKNERPLPADDQSLAAIARIGVADWGAMSTKIRAFFVTRPSRVTNADEMVHKRCNRELIRQARMRKDGKRRQEKYRERNMLEPVSRDTPVSNALVTLPQDRTGQEKGGEKRDIQPSSVVRSDTDETDFDSFWKAYPSRGKAANPKKPAMEAWSRALKRGATPEQLIAAAPAAAPPDKRGTEFVPMASTWLNQDRWRDQPKPEPAKPDDGLSVVERLRIEGFKKNGRWLPTWGPPPEPRSAIIGKTGVGGDWDGP